MSEQATERRLEREARETCLGYLGDPANFTDAARVEVTWADENEVEHCGYFIVRVKTRPSDDLADHPATLATERVELELDRRANEYRWTYTSVDDVCAA